MVKRFVARAVHDLSNDELADVLVELEDINLKCSLLYMLLLDAYALWEASLYRCDEAWRVRYPNLHDEFDPIAHLSERYGDDFLVRALKDWQDHHINLARRNKEYLYVLLRNDPSWLGVDKLVTLIISDWADQEVSWKQFALRQTPDSKKESKAQGGRPRYADVREKRELLAIRWIERKSLGCSVSEALAEINAEITELGLGEEVTRVDRPENWLISRRKLAECAKALARFETSLFGKALREAPPPNSRI